MRLRERQFAAHLFVWVAMVLLGTGLSARASVAVLVEEPYGHLGGMDPAGHSAIYFDHICAESAIKLRPCRPGELGVVISRYDGVGKYDWMASPLLDYLYAVDRADQVPAYADAALEWKLRDDYRRAHLEFFAPDTNDGKRVPGNWYELAGAAYDRTLYGFQVKTTPEQDARIMALFNDRPNTTHYNGMFRNCADFARVTINMAYPHAVRRNFLADFGLMSPKQVAHGLSKYAAQHPEAGLTTFIVHQVPGTLPRSHRNKGLAESLLTSPRYVLPMTIFEPYATGVMVVAYFGNGRFTLPREAPELNLVAPAQPVAVQVAVESAANPAPPEAYPTAWLRLNDREAFPWVSEAGSSVPALVPVQTMFVTQPASH